MSTTQHIIPLTAVMEPDMEEDWLEGQGLSRPDGWERSRNPTAGEVRRVLETMEGVKFDGGVDGQDLSFAVENGTDGTLLILKGYAPEMNEDAPLEMYFDKGSAAWRLQVQITERLTHSCGPLLLADSYFIVVVPGTPPDAPWHKWRVS